MSANRRRRAERRAYSEYEALLKRLHDLNGRGLLDSPEADEIRELMEDPWSALLDEEKRGLAGLSADLYSLAGEELPGKLGPDERAEALAKASEEYARRDWNGLLRVLRKAHDFLAPPVVAYIRGRCWHELGRAAPEFWFFNHAHQLEPQNIHYSLLALDAQLRAGERSEAMARALALIDGADTPTQLVFGASKVLYDAASILPRDDAAQLYERIAAALKPALVSYEKRQDKQMLPSLVVAARINLALALDRLGRDSDARQAFNAAVSEHPESDEVLLARAMFLLRVDRDEGLRDLHALVGRNTSLVHPFFFLAHDALLSDDYRTCLDLCERALRLTTRTDLRANVLEWTAISLYELGQPTPLVRSYFQYAAASDPLNDAIRTNLELHERLTLEHGHESKFDVRLAIDPADALDDLQSRLQPAA